MGPSRSRPNHPGATKKVGKICPRNPRWPTAVISVLSKNVRGEESRHNITIVL
jgi:hypothetical protein